MIFDLQLSASEFFPCYRQLEVWAVVEWHQLNPWDPPRMSRTPINVGPASRLSPSKFHFPSSLVIFGNLRSSLTPFAPFLDQDPVEPLWSDARRLARNQRRLSRRQGLSGGSGFVQNGKIYFQPQSARPVRSCRYWRDPRPHRWFFCRRRGAGPNRQPVAPPERNMPVTSISATAVAPGRGRCLNRKRRHKESQISLGIFSLQSR